MTPTVIQHVLARLRTIGVTHVFGVPGDYFVVETGTVSMGLGFTLLPRGVTYHNRTLWGSIGWATPAAFGAALAAPHKRVVRVRGEGEPTRCRLAEGPATARCGQDIVQDMIAV